ncbi:MULTISPECIES: hypothetical protein [unclassified Sphingobium]|uniref:hypothetical protein n=1 Tax=unclassified Sphingobium TaxID=2611147 RepID=UPI0035A7193D
MTADIHLGLRNVVLTVDDVRHWKARLARIDGEINALQSEKEDFSRKLAAAALFLDVDAVVPGESEATEAESPPIGAEEQPKAEPAASAPVQRKRRNYGRLTWRDVILAAVEPAEMGLTYAELRAAVRESELGPQLEASEKGYHNAISRCARDEEVVRDHGRVFTPAAFKRFMAAVEAGEVSTTVPQPMAYSPMGEAILDIVAARPGQLNGKGIIGELRKDTEFNATLTPHETSAYNIIARLVRRGQIVRRDDGTILPGRNFPQDRIQSDANSNEAPNGNVAGASQAGEAPTSPNEAPPLFRVVK